jgi:radical SAM-linked protein
VQKIRFRYAKRGRLRFSSHRDFQRALERAVRRAAIPVAFSAGFNPHPRISYANAAPTGSASEAEYVEIALSSHVDCDWFRRALDDALPPGLDILEAVDAPAGALADRLEASYWKIELPGVPQQAAAAALERFLAATEVVVQRLTKTGMRTFDARGAVVSAEALEVVENGTSRVAQVTPVDCAILQVVIRHSTPAVRPDDVLAALRSQADLAPPSPPRMTRLAQGPLNAESGTVADPLATDQGVIGA